MDGVPVFSGQGSYLFPVDSPRGLACDEDSRRGLACNEAGTLFALSTQGVRLLPDDEDGIVDGTSPRNTYPENLTGVLQGLKYGF